VCGPLSGLLSNRFFVLAAGGSLFGQLLVVYFPPLQEVFQTEALSLWDWLLIVSLASTVLVVDEVRKVFVRRRLPPPGPREKAIGESRTRARSYSKLLPPV